MNTIGFVFFCRFFSLFFSLSTPSSGVICSVRVRTCHVPNVDFIIYLRIYRGQDGRCYIYIPFDKCSMLVLISDRKRYKLCTRNNNIKQSPPPPPSGSDVRVCVYPRVECPARIASLITTRQNLFANIINVLIFVSRVKIGAPPRIQLMAMDDGWSACAAHNFLLTIPADPDTLHTPFMRHSV